MTLGGVPGSGALAYLARLLLAGKALDGVAAPQGPLVVVLPDADAVEDVADAVKALAPLFGGAQEACAVFADDGRERLASLELLRAGARLALGTPEGLAAPAPAAADFQAKTVRLRSGDLAPRSKIVDALLAAGYQRVDFVESPGEFAVRGAVLDFHALEPAVAYRVLYDEDRVASIRTVDPVSQEPGEVLVSAEATPAEEPAEGGKVSDWLTQDALWLVTDGVEGAAAPEGARRLDLGRGAEEGLDFGAKALGPYAGDPAKAWAEMARDHADGRPSRAIRTAGAEAPSARTSVTTVSARPLGRGYRNPTKRRDREGGECECLLLHGVFPNL